jgi:hypothetical protein
MVIREVRHIVMTPAIAAAVRMNIPQMQGAASAAPASNYSATINPGIFYKYRTTFEPSRLEPNSCIFLVTSPKAGTRYTRMAWPCFSRRY